MNAPETLTRPERTATADAASAAVNPDFERLLQKPAFRPQDLMEGDSLDRIERIAIRMAEGRMTVPEYLRGNVGDCMAIAMQAMLWNMDPFVVAQKTHIVSGRLGYEAQLVIAVVMASGAIRGSFRFEHEGEGPSLRCRAGAVLRGESNVTWGEWLDISAVTTKNSPLWKTNPRQQMAYLQAKNWSRIFCPGAILGVYTVDELLDAEPMAFGGSSGTPAPTPASRAELPAYAEADFTKNLPAWRKLVEGGKKTAGDLLAMLSTKATFSEQQKAQILALKALKPAHEVSSSADGSGLGASLGPGARADAPTFTFAEVESALLKAENADAMDDAADLIGGVADEQQRGELRALHDKRRAALEG